MTDILDAFLVLFEQARPWIGGALCLIGGLLAIVGTIGVLRFPDFYTRLHAASVTDTSAATSLIIGMALLPDTTWLGFAKLAVIWVFLFITGPTATHAAANAAHTAGLQPVTGRASKGGES